jgi:hypothetical protein
MPRGIARGVVFFSTVLWQSWHPEVRFRLAIFSLLAASFLRAAEEFGRALCSC